ncbi:hypothetical protein ABKN59_010524 [Abortiporus biennis]
MILVIGVPKPTLLLGLTHSRALSNRFLPPSFPAFDASNNDQPLSSLSRTWTIVSKEFNAFIACSLARLGLFFCFKFVLFKEDTRP